MIRFQLLIKGRDYIRWNKKCKQPWQVLLDSCNLYNDSKRSMQHEDKTQHLKLQSIVGTVFFFSVFFLSIHEITSRVKQGVFNLQPFLSILEEAPSQSQRLIKRINAAGQHDLRSGFSEPTDANSRREWLTFKAGLSAVWIFQAHAR